MTTRLAMWSGPRNISTALMRAFDARGDCAVVDEPLYAAYLHATGLDHPGRDEVLASQPTDPKQVLHQLQQLDHGQPLQFEKHMAQHWQSDWTLHDFGPARHALLIRDPQAVAPSFAKVRGMPTPQELGIAQQAQLFDALTAARCRVVVVDGDELRAQPHRMLQALCEALEIPFLEQMLAWKAGSRSTDGVWARYWYQTVWQSTGFQPPGPLPQDLPPPLQAIVDDLRPEYVRLAALRLRPQPDMD